MDHVPVRPMLRINDAPEAEGRRGLSKDGATYVSSMPMLVSHFHNREQTRSRPIRSRAGRRRNIDLGHAELLVEERPVGTLSTRRRRHA